MASSTDQTLNWVMINKLINGQKLTNIKTDYSSVSLFKALLIGTWHHLSDERLADSLSRDLVFMNFCEFSISGNKPDATTHPANDSEMTHFGAVENKNPQNSLIKHHIYGKIP